MHNVPKWSNTLKNFVAFARRFFKCDNFGTYIKAKI